MHRPCAAGTSGWYSTSHRQTTALAYTYHRVDASGAGLQGKITVQQPSRRRRGGHDLGHYRRLANGGASTRGVRGTLACTGEQCSDCQGAYPRANRERSTPTLAQHAYRWQYRLMLRSAPHFATNFLGGSAVMMVDGHRCHCIIPSSRKLGLYQVIKSVMIRSPKLHSQTRTPNTKRRWTTLHATAFHCPCRVPETRARAVSP